MKKLYTTQTACDLKFSRSHDRISFFKGVLLGTAVVLFLSNVSPVFSAKLDLTKVSLESVKNTAVVYPQTILSPYTDDNSGMSGYNSVINVLTVDGRSIREDAQNIFTAGIVVVSNSKQDKKTKNAIVLNPKTYTTKKKSAVIGSMARALGLSNSAIDSEYNHQDGIEEYTFVNDYSSRARAEGNADIAIGTKSETRAYGNVILGDGSATKTPAGEVGYSSLRKGPANTDNFAWKSTAPAVTVGDHKNTLSRQIQGVAAGTLFTDAANVGQIKALELYVDQGWKLSVGGKDATTVGITSVVDLSTANNNLKITKGQTDNNVKFALADDINVMTVTAGESIMSAVGFGFEGGKGPSITVNGIHAGDKTIKGVAAGEEDTDAVNFAQLQETKDQIVKNSLVKQDEGEAGRITIGKEIGGSVINVTNKSGDARTISGVKAAENDDEAVNKKQLDGEIADIVDTIKSNSLVKREEETNRITIGKEIEGAEINITNKSGKDRTISGVKAAENDDEAVNKKQLDGEIADITDSIKVIKEANSFAVLYDKNTDGTVNYNSVTLGGDKTTAPVALLNVKDGKIAENSHDAINGNQINQISGDIAEFFGGGTKFENGIFKRPRYNLTTIDKNGEVKGNEYNDVGSALSGLDTNIRHVNNHLIYAMNDTASYFGGGAGYDDQKEWHAPIFKVIHFEDDGTSSKQPYNNVADAFEGVNNSFTNIHNQISNITENSIVKQDGEDNLITVGKATGGTKISIVNKDNQERTLSGVRKGELSQTSTDAINGSQLFEIAKNTSKYFGGGADVSNGKAPTYTIQGKSHNDFESTFNAVDTSITKIQNQIANVTKNSLIKQEENEGAITIGKDTAGTEINIAGVGKLTRKISGVQAAEKGDEAVNKDQLDKSIEKISKDIETASIAAVLYDKNEDGIVNYGRVTLGGVENNGPVALLNVKDGRISQDSHDAINGSQINKISKDIANYFGGGTEFVNGAFKGPKYSLSVIVEEGQVAKANYYNVGDALTGLDTNVKSVNTHLTNVVKDVNEKITNITQEVKGNVLLWSDDEQAFVAQHGEGRTNSKIKFLANGDISKDSTDAINGSQLFEVKSAITDINENFKDINTNISKYFGGGADVSNGKAPTYIIQGKPHNDVESTFNAVDTSITNIQNQIANVTENSLVKQEKNEGTITIGKATGGSVINITNKSGEDRTISGVKAAVANNEAVNKAQLDKSIEKISKDINLASAAAVLYDKENGTINYKSVTLGGDKTMAPVALHNVQAGIIAEGSHDAINGSQIEKISRDVAGIFGGDAEFSDGILFGPHYHLSRISEDGTSKDFAFYDVGSALTGLDVNINNVNTHLTNVVKDVNEKITNITQEVKGDALLWSDADEAFVALHGKGDKRGKSKLKFLADGDISEGSMEAITGNQLYLMSNQLAMYFGGGAGYQDGKWTAPNFQVAQFNVDGTVGKKISYNNVASAFDGVSESMSKINNRIQNVEKNVSSNSLNWNEQKGMYDASHKGKASKIDSVANGKIEKDSKEAVNGGQLWETNERISGVEKDVQHISNRVDNISNTIADIGETVLNIDAKVDNIDNRINSIAENTVRYDTDKTGQKTNKITLKGGDPSEPVMIDNVADGRIEKGSKEAINGGQLHDYTEQQMKIVLDDAKKYTDSQVKNIVINAIDDAVDRADQYTDMKFNILTYDIKNVRKEARQAAAIGLAVSNLRYFDDPGSLSVSFGSGTWRGQSAFALGAGYTSENGKIRSNLSATSAGGHWGVGGAITLKIK
ncbi:Vomp family autotransporter [Bartonella sp. ML70XJBT.G]|uniref:Vomp family autotransporter n=1 Tax=Bartonella sp. ML70XJBT.G TaxID=3019093 RepID=UPI002361BCD7|nr:Vomp family autotransporter [Bartonella sp. ML70XJBT.G]